MLTVPCQLASALRFPGCRVPARRRRIALGAVVLLLALHVAPAPASLTTGALDLDANFHTISVRGGFATADGAAGNAATVEYRRPGEPAWRTAPPTWLDVRPTLAFAGAAANWARDEARTKIFGLAPGVTYEVRVTFTGAVSGTNPIAGTIATRDAAPPAPALRTVYVSAAGDDGSDGLAPGSPKRTLAGAFAIAAAGDRIWVAPGVYPHAAAAMLAASGTPAQWIRVTRWPGLPGAAIVEGTGANDYVLVVAGSYVRIDGLTIRRARAACIRIEGGTTDHWIDGNVVTDWNADDGAAVQHEAGISARSNAERLVVLDNLLKRRDLLPGPQHGGGNGIWLKNEAAIGTGGGHHVIRGNTIIGGYDGIGSEAENDARGGFYVNADVYENVVSDAQDDGIQMEGADVNCAVFANVVRRGPVGIAFAPNGVGPLFVMRNRHVSPTWSLAGALYKTGDATDARTWIFHESGYDPDAGAATGANAVAQTNPGFSSFHARNNAWQVDRYAVETTTPVGGGAAPSMDYDALFTTDASGRFVKWYDVLRPTLAAFQAMDGQEPHGLERELAALDWTNAADGGFTLLPGAALRDAGVPIPGVNSDLEDPAWRFAGAAPDIGAVEDAGADATAPAVAIAAPAADATLAGTATVTASASDAAGVARVDFFVDGTLAGTDASPPYELRWITTAVVDGAHLLAASAVDAAGNAARSDDVRVFVDNGLGGARNAYGCYKAKLAPGTRFERREITVTDQLETKQTVVLKPLTAANPAVVDAGTIVDPVGYRTCYKIKDAAGEPRFVAREVAFATAFGADRWTIKRARELCVPATRDGSPVAPARDAFKCYQAKTAPDTPRFVRRDVTVTDELGAARLTVKKPALYCTPARDDGAPATDPAARLACYRGTLARGEPRFEKRALSVTDALGDHDMIAIKPHVLCLPAAELPAP